MSDNSIDQNSNPPQDSVNYKFYEDFCQITDTNITYSEFCTAIELLKDRKGELGSTFNPPTNFGSIIDATLPVLAETAGNIAQDTIDDILGKSEQAIRAQAQQMRDRFASRLSGNSGISDIGDGGDGGTSTSDYSGGSAYNPTGLSLNLKPVNSSFKTNIVPLYRPKYFLDGQDATAPLIVKCVNVFLEYTINRFMGQETIDRFCQNAMIAAYVNSLSTRLKPNSFTSGIAGNRRYITSYFMILSYALATYYSYASIITHFRMPGNRNEGMIKLYSSLSVTDINQIGILGRTLDGIPIPPRLNEFLFHLYGNYKQSHEPGSTLVKAIPFTFKDAGDSKKMGTIKESVPAILEMLRTKPFRDVQQVFANAYPELVNTTVMHYSGAPEFDANWNSWFVNLPYYGCTSSDTKIIPSCVSDKDNVRFNLHTDAPDGWIEMASSIFHEPTDQFYAGLGAPKSLSLTADPDTGQPIALSEDLNSTYIRSSVGDSGVSSAFIYRNDTDWNGSFYDAFWPLSAREENQILSGNTYKVHHASANTNSFLRYGTERAEPRTARDSAITTQQMIEYLYFPVSMQPKSFTPKATVGEAMDAESPKPKRRRRRKSSK